MKVNSVSPVLVVICACLVVIPGAIVGTPGVVEDQLFPEQPPDITVEPAAGAEQHVNTTQTVDGNTRVNIEIANPGVNTDATTTFRDLITITHNDRTDARPVIVEIDQPQSNQSEQGKADIAIGQDVTAGSGILTDDVAVADVGVGEQFRLGVGKSTTVGLAIDTEGVDAGETVSTTFTIRAERISVSLPPALITGTAAPTAEVTVDAGDEVSVGEFVDLTATGSTVTSLSSLVEGQVDAPSETQVVIDGPFNLSADDSAVTASGTIRATLDRSAVETPSEDIRIVHSPDGNNWTFLETDVTVTGQGGELILEATPQAERYGTVAVVDDSNVQFVWSGDLPESVAPSPDGGAGETVNTLTSQNGAGGDRIQIGGAMPTASVFLSTKSSELVDQLKTTAGITTTETDTDTEQLQGEATPSGPTGFAVENMNFDERGSKNITVTLVDADGRQSIANTTIDVIDPSTGGTDSEDDDSDSKEESQTPTEEQKQEQQPEQPEQVAPVSQEQGSDIEVDVETKTGTTAATGQEAQTQEQTSVDVTSISEDSLPEGQTQPNAVIATEASVSVAAETGETENANADTDASAGSEIAAESETSGLEVSDADIITTTDEEVTLSGSRSTAGSTETVSVSRQVSAAVDIDPQSIQEDSEATVTLTADRSTLGEINPDTAVIGHLTDDGWQVLDTDVAVRGESVVLAAETPGFSPFAIFANPDVQYTWTLPDGSTETGRDIQTAFTKPGIYEAQLTVTNSLGRSDTTTQTIIVNDIPAIENVSTTQTRAQAQTDGNETTLTANVSNEVGDISVRWEFPDGTIKTGQTVTYPTQKRQYAVQLHVEDEYGGEASSVETVVTPPQETLINQQTVPQQVLVPGILSVIGILGSVAGYRVVPWARILTRIRRNPRIVELGTPFYEHENRCLGVDSLVVEDDNRPIIAIRLSIVDDSGDKLLTKEITPDGTATTELGSYRYELTPATLYVPPSLSIDDTATHTIAVKTVNEKENTATKHTAEFTFDA